MTVTVDEVALQMVQAAFPQLGITPEELMVHEMSHLYDTATGKGGPNDLYAEDRAWERQNDYRQERGQSPLPSWMMAP